MATHVQEVEEQRKILSNFVLLFTTSVGVYLTYRGLAALQPLVVAVPLACTSGIVQYVCWRFLLEQWPKAELTGRAKLTMRIAIPVVVLIGLTSTSLAFFGMAAPHAQRKGMVDTVDEAAALIQQLKTKRQQEARLVPILEQGASEWKQMAEDERRSGRFSRRGKRGKIYGDLQAIGRSFESAAKVVKDSRQNAVEAISDAEETLMNMRHIASSAEADSSALEEATGQFSKKLFDLNTALAVAQESPIENVLRARAKLSEQGRELVSKRWCFAV